jgi:hypothetical protein
VSDYDAAYAAAKDKPPFSNGTEGYAWMGNWCDECSKNDEEIELWCPLLSVALLGRTPVEWIEQTADGHRLGDTYHCTAFAPRDDGNGGGGPPVPPSPFDEEQPGQTDIFTFFAEDAIEQLQPERVTA